MGCGGSTAVPVDPPVAPPPQPRPVAVPAQKAPVPALAPLSAPAPVSTPAPPIKQPDPPVDVKHDVADAGKSLPITEDAVQPVKVLESAEAIFASEPRFHSNDQENVPEAVCPDNRNSGQQGENAELLEASAAVPFQEVVSDVADQHLTTESDDAQEAVGEQPAPVEPILDGSESANTSSAASEELAAVAAPPTEATVESTLVVVQSPDTINDIAEIVAEITDSVVEAAEAVVESTLVEPKAPHDTITTSAELGTDAAAHHATAEEAAIDVAETTVTGEHPSEIPAATIEPLLDASAPDIPSNETDPAESDSLATLPSDAPGATALDHNQATEAVFEPLVEAETTLRTELHIPAEVPVEEAADTPVVQVHTPSQLVLETAFPSHSSSAASMPIQPSNQPESGVLAIIRERERASKAAAESNGSTHIPLPPLRSLGSASSLTSGPGSKTTSFHSASSAKDVKLKPRPASNNFDIDYRKDAVPTVPEAIAIFQEVSAGRDLEHAKKATHYHERRLDCSASIQLSDDAPSSSSSSSSLLPVAETEAEEEGRVEAAVNIGGQPDNVATHEVAAPVPTPAAVPLAITAPVLASGDDRVAVEAASNGSVTGASSPPPPKQPKPAMVKGSSRRQVRMGDRVVETTRKIEKEDVDDMLIEEEMRRLAQEESEKFLKRAPSKPTALTEEQLIEEQVKQLAAEEAARAAKRRAGKPAAPASTTLPSTPVAAAVPTTTPKPPPKPAGMKKGK